MEGRPVIRQPPHIHLADHGTCEYLRVLCSGGLVDEFVGGVIHERRIGELLIPFLGLEHHHSGAAPLLVVLQECLPGREVEFGSDLHQQVVHQIPEMVPVQITPTR